MKKLAKRSILTVIAVILGIFGLAAVGCSNEEKPKQPDFTPIPYYCDVNGDEYTLTLNKSTFSFTKNNELRTGKYKTDEDGKLSLEFSKDEIAPAEKFDGWLSLTYKNVAMRFYESKYYTVTYSTDGGSEIASHTIKNGKTLAKPADPTRGGDKFVGWYTDNNYKTPFMFGTQPVTGDLSLYARFVSNTDATKREFNISFDLCYDGAVNPQTMQTLGGRLYGVNDPVRDGYKFMGWYVSMTGEKDPATNAVVLSYKYDETTVFAENTTLYALWHSAESSARLPMPNVNVTSQGVSWESVGATASGYAVTVDGPNDYTDSTVVTGTTYVKDFSQLPAGDYRITVTARSGGGESTYSETAVRVYRNKALARVSLFSVDDMSNFIYNGVENAERYIINIKCGDDGHEHSMLDNGSSLYYNFAGCMMRDEGIEFTVTAEADGYASSTSQTYRHFRNLDAISSIEIDEATDTVVWQPVDKATSYIVSVSCGNKAHEHTHVNNGGKTSYSLKECANGEVTVNVYPATTGYNSPAPVTAKYNKKSLATPTGLSIVGDTLKWDGVFGVSDYAIDISGKRFTVSNGETSFDLTDERLEWDSQTMYQITVQAVSGDSVSHPSDAIDASYFAWSQNVKYSENTVSWKFAICADSYEVRVNYGDIQSFVGVNRAKIALTRSGINTISVRYNDGGFRSDWAKIEVYAYAVVFDTSGVSGTVDTQYVAYGDEIDLSVGESLSQTGYEFDAWYSTAGGAASNGTRYTDPVFKGHSPIVLYANYSPRTYTVTLDYNGKGEGSAKTVQIKYNSEFEIPVPDKAFSQTDGFVGWYSNSGEDGRRYTDESGKGLERWDVAQDITVYAGWRPILKFVKENSYYVVYKGDGINNVSTVTVPATFKGEDDDRAYPVKVISDSSFKSCSQLVTINIPNSITNIDIKAFQGCTLLENINVYGADGINEFIYESEDGVLFYNNQQTLAKDLWFYPMGRTDSMYVLPDGVVNIPTGGFYQSKFQEVVIPSSVAYMQIDAFYDTKSLNTVTFAENRPGTVVRALDIRPGAFERAVNLNSVVLPSRYDNFNRMIFYKNSKLTSVSVNPGGKYGSTKDGMLYENTKSGRVLVYCPESRNDANLRISNEVTIIGTHAFSGCKITGITIPNSISEIQKSAFGGYTTKLTENGADIVISACALKSVRFAGGGIMPLVVGESAFGYEEPKSGEKVNTKTGCTSLATVTFDSTCNVVSLGNRAFSGCPIVSIQLPNSVTSLGDRTFADCAKLNSFGFAQSSDIDPTKSLSIGNGCFSGCIKLESITLPYYVKSFEEGVFAGCTMLNNVFVDINNPVLSDVDGILFDKNITEIKFYPTARVGEYVLPDTVTKIGNGVFQGKTSLKKITIGNKIAQIGDNAFKGCTNLTDVVFITDGRAENATLVLGASAFYGCTALENINIPSGVTEIPNQLFYNCLALSDFALPNGITEIGKEAFYDCNGLTGTFVIPNTVIGLGYRAFYSCDGLEKIEFERGGDKALYMYDTDGKYNTGKSTETFYYCRQARDVVLPERLKNIGANAFGHMSALERVNIPTTVEYIDKGAFYYCKSLTVVSFDLDVTYDFVIADSTSSSAGMFNNCESLRTITMPKGLKRVPNYCFYYCKSLETVNLPNTLRNDPYLSNTADQLCAIGNSAFYYCQNLTTLNIASGGEGEFSLGTNVFYNCKLLTTVTLPARLADRTEKKDVKKAAVVLETLSGSYVENIVVKDATADTDYISVDGILYKDKGATLVICPIAKSGAVEIPYATTTILDKSFYGNKGITSVTFAGKPATVAEGETPEQPSDLLVIGGNESSKVAASAAFGNTAISSIVFPSRLKSINNFAFSNNAELMSVTFTSTESDPSYLETIGESVFLNCPKLTSVSFPASLVSIGKNAFQNNVKLSTVEFASDCKLTTIGDTAFQNTAINTIRLPSKTTTLGKEVFAQCMKLSSIALPDCLKSMNSLFTDCYDLQTITVYSTGMDSPSLTIDNGVVYSDGGKTLQSYPLGKTDSLYVIPAGVTSIAASAFAFNQYLQTVYIPDTVETVGEKAFYMCGNLVSVYFRAPDPDELAEAGGYSDTPAAPVKAKALTLGNYAFANTSKLQTVELPQRVSSFGTYVFAYTDSLRSVEFLTGVDDNGATTYCTALAKINNYDFYYSGIQSFDIPDCVKTIGQYAFRYSGLKSIVIPDSITDLGGAASGYAFANCADLETVVFESGGTSALTMRNYAFYQCPNLTSITLSDRATTTGTYMCQGCVSLSTVNFPGEKLTTIAANAFEGCTSLTTVNLPASLVTLNTAFKNTGLTSIVIPASVKTLSASFASGSPLARVEFANGSQLVTLTANLFSNDLNLREVVLPSNSSMTAIGASAFKGCTNLSRITYNGSTTVMADGIAELPSGILTINNYVFEGCTGLTSFSMSDTVKTVGDYAFRYCSNIADVHISTAIEKIGLRAFEETGIVDLFIPKSINSLGGYAFQTCHSLNTVEFERGSNLTTMRYSATATHSYAFDDCINLESVILPDGLEYLGTYAFNGCTKLKAVSFPSTIQYIGAYAFNECTELASITFESNEGVYALETIGNSAFAKTSVQSVVIPYSVKSIGQRAFELCRSLTSVTFDDDGGAPRLESLGTYAFKNCEELTAFEIPMTVNSIGANPFLYDSKLVLTMNAANATFKMHNGMLYNNDLTILLVCPGYITGEVILASTCVEIKGEAFVGSQIESISMTQTGFTINDWAFNYCRSLTKVEIGNEVYVGKLAFRYCEALIDITIGENCTVNDQAFYHCTSLETLVIPTGTKLGINVTEGCTNLSNVTVGDDVTIGGSSANIDFVAGTIEVIIDSNVAESAFKDNVAITSVVIKEGVTSIGNGAFENCTALTTVKLPSTLKNIDGSAFYGCTNLTDINLQDTSLEYIGEDGANYRLGQVFRKCESLQNVILPETLLFMGAHCFSNTALVNLTIPASTRLYGSASTGSQFYSTTSLESVTFAENSVMTVLPGYVFWDSAVKTVVLPKNITSIGTYAFNNSGITQLEIPNTVTSIGGSAFSSCKSLTTVTFEEGSVVSSFGERAFKESSIRSITLPATARTFNYYSNTGGSGGGPLALSGVFSNCADLEQVIFETREDGTSDLTTINYFMFQNCTNLKDITLPKSVTTIAQEAFSGCSSLASISVPSSVKSISTKAFKDCVGLQTLTFEKDDDGNTALTTISTSAFENCALTELRLPDSLTQLYAAFAGNPLRSVVLPAGLTSSNSKVFSDMPTLETVVVPEGIKTISESMFARCTNISEIVIPSSVALINAGAFEGWTSEQTIKIKLKGPLSKWNGAWRRNCNATFVWNYGAAVEQDSAA